MRRDSMEKTKDILNKDLLILDSKISVNFENLMVQFYNITNWDLLNMCMDGAKTLDEFKNEQKRAITNTAYKLDRFETYIKKVVCETCEDSYRQFLKDNKIPVGGED